MCVPTMWSARTQRDGVHETDVATGGYRKSLKASSRRLRKAGSRFVVTDPADGADGRAELLQIVLAALALEQVHFETGTGAGVQRSVQVGRDKLDELVAIHRSRHDASCR